MFSYKLYCFSTTVTATSSNPGLIPNPTVTYASPAATGSLSYTPVANANGSAVITVTVTDDGGTANGGVNTTTRTFTVAVTAVHDAPTLATISDPTAILEDASAQTVNLTGINAGGGETQTLTVTASSSNPSLIPNPTVTYTNPAATGSLSYKPVANANGTAVITVTVTDDGGTANGGVNTTTRTFTVAVTAVNDTPTVVLAIADFAVNEDAANVVTTLTTLFSDIETATTALTYAVVANTNTALVTATITDSTNLTLAFAANGNGTSRISVSATDPGGLSVTNTFVVTVNAVNDAPVVVLPIADFAVNEDAANVVTNLTLTFSDVETAATAMTYAVVANTNSALVTAMLVQGTNLTLVFAADGNGTSLFAVSATDAGGLSVTNTFVVTVNPVNDAPVVLLPIANFAVDGGAANVVSNLTTIFSDLETPAASLNYAVVGNTNTALITATITSGTNLTLAFAANGLGTSQLSVSATDAGGLSVTNTFVVTVNAVVLSVSADRVSGALLLSWSLTAVNYVLEVSPTLGVSAVWTPVATPVQTDSQSRFVLLSQPASQQFYRLRQSAITP